jgi:hypothetical protein
MERNTTMKSKAKPDGLIGMFGHTVNDDGAIVWQFQIIRRSDDVTSANCFLGWMVNLPPA